jgi:hypothetical protein
MRGRGVSSLIRRKLSRKRPQEDPDDKKETAPLKPFSNDCAVDTKPDAIWLQSHVSVFSPGFQMYGRVILSSSFKPCVVTISSSSVQLTTKGSGRLLKSFQFCDIAGIKYREMPEEKLKKFARSAVQFEEEHSVLEKLELEQNQFAIVTTKCGFNRGQVIIFATTR